jgi:uncharacterized protein involved in exopolysaccharide biosynthesis
MQNATAWRSEPGEAFAALAPAPARYTPRDLAAMLWRERGLMLAVFLAVTALGLVAALAMKTSYQAHSSLLVRLSPEYVYNPRVGDAARGLAPETDSVVESEAEILGSAGLRARVLADIGLPRFEPKSAHAYQVASPAKRKDMEAAAIKAMGSALKVATAPGDSVVRLTYADSDPQRSALVLNTLVDEYLRYRTTVLTSRDAGLIGQQARDFQSRLDAADAELNRFMADNDVSDFDAEKLALSNVYTQLLTDSYNVTAQLSESEGRLGATAAEFGRTPAEIGLSRDLDHTAADKMITLRLQRQDLLSRYRASAQPVTDLDRQIAELEALDAAGQSTGPGAKRVGVNPVFQTLQTERNQLQAEAASLRARKASLAAELAQVSARRQRLNELQPQYDDMLRRRDLLAANVKALLQRQQESQAQQSLDASAAGDGDVKVIERALPPTTGSSLRKPVFGAALVFAVFAALCAGLFRAFLRRGIPTRDYAERSLGLPILAAPGFKPARA